MAVIKRDRSVSPQSPLKRPRLKICWDYKKPTEISSQKWRGVQVLRFIDHNPDAKGKEVNT